jgi:hypothetical protein
MVGKGAEYGRMEAHCEGGQGPPRAVMPRKKKKKTDILEMGTASIFSVIPEGCHLHYAVYSKLCLNKINSPKSKAFPHLNSMKCFLN